jgi:hypothetical protein
MSHNVTHKATPAETIDGTTDNKAITPKSLGTADGISFSNTSSSSVFIMGSGGIQAPICSKQLGSAGTMIDLYSASIGSGNAIEAVGAKTLTTTHFIKVNIATVGDRYIPCGTIA